MERKDGLLLAGFLAFSALYVLGTGSTKPERSTEWTFCTGKAVTILKELESLVRTRGGRVGILDACDDGAAWEYVLTTDAGVTNPADPVSGNYAAGRTWRYKRLVTVEPLPGAPGGSARLVRVKVCLDRDEDGDGEPDIQAEAAGVIRAGAEGLSPYELAAMGPAAGTAGRVSPVSRA